MDSLIVEQINRSLRDEDEARRALIEIRQRRIAAELGRNRRSIDGLGAPVAQIATDAYHRWGQLLGYRCWKDKAFLREFLRDNPHARVQASGTKEISVGWMPTSPRYHMAYG